MVTKDSKVVMFDSDDAAHFQTGISGWVSRNGHYWGNDERAARYDGCTHTRCQVCGEPVDKGWLICPKCKEARDIKRYEAMPKEDWDETGMLYSDAADRYFQSWDEVEDYLDDEGGTMESLRLIICVGMSLPLLPDDYGCDDIAEDGELPNAAIEAIGKFNETIKSIGFVSWFPGKKATTIPHSL